MSRLDTELMHFLVPDAENVNTLDTTVTHHCDSSTKYELITITQVNWDGSTDVVCLTRDQLVALANQLKGH